MKISNLKRSSTHFIHFQRVAMRTRNNQRNKNVEEIRDRTFLIQMSIILGRRRFRTFLWIVLDWKLCKMAILKRPVRKCRRPIILDRVNFFDPKYPENTIYVYHFQISCFTVKSDLRALYIYEWLCNEPRWSRSLDKSGCFATEWRLVRFVRRLSS